MEINNIQKKALIHASKILNNADTYPIYNAVLSALQKAEVSENNTKDILKVLQAESHKLKQISEDAKEWIDAIIKDSN